MCAYSASSCCVAQPRGDSGRSRTATTRDTAWLLAETLATIHPSRRGMGRAQRLRGGRPSRLEGHPLDEQSMSVWSERPPASREDVLKQIRPVDQGKGAGPQGGTTQLLI